MNNTLTYLKKEKKFLIVLFLISFFIRLIFFLYFTGKNRNSWCCTDSAEYNSVAVNMVNGKGILKADGDYNFRRLPGYSIFLAGCYKLFGDTDFNKALWIQIFLSCLIPVFVFFLSLLFFPSNLLLAKISAIYSAFHLGLILYSGVILTETLFVIFFLLFCLFFLSNFKFFFCKKEIVIFSYKKIFFSGILLGICSLIRPVGHYMIIISILLLLFSNIDFVKKISGSLSLFFSWFLIVFGWILRNYFLTGCIFFHTLPGIGLLHFSASYIDSDINKSEYYESKIKLETEWNNLIMQNKRENGKKNDDIQSCYIAEKLALDYIKKHPLLFLKHCVIQVCKTCFGLNSTTLLFMDSKTLPDYNRNTKFIDKIKRFLFPKVNAKIIVPIIYLEILLLFLVYVGFVGFCIFTFFDKEFFCILLKIFPFIFLLIMLTFLYGCARLRLPIEPFLIILAFYFWISVLGKEKQSE